MKGMTDYAYNCRILVDGGIYIKQNTMKSILELRFNPSEGIAYVQSATKGLSLLCCRSRSNNETEEIVGNLPKGYIGNVPLPRVPRDQSTFQSRVPPVRHTLPCYYENTYAIPMYSDTY